nr:NADH dehydrogenase subunit 5 [Azana sp. WQY005]
MFLLSICSISSLILFFFSFMLFIMGLVMLYLNLIYFIEYEICTLNSSMIVMTILLDWMSLIFMSFVLMISSMVIFYSKEYMSGDKTINRFILLILMFIFSMMLLIISPNLISILLGWDGLGLVSYCLVIYFQNVKSFNAGMLTALSNRIGDVALLISIAWMLNFGGWNYIFYVSLMNNFFEMNIVGGLVILASMTKSAQIPFSSWLPAAMAAPTPVSSLVHSSTLVTAGVYLLIRFNCLILNNLFGQGLLLMSGLTMFMSGLGANFEFDLKKIIALSTLSQLGLMLMILSLGFYQFAFFHLLTHALFKALMFMCAGSIIHSMNNFQDIRYFGGLYMNLPLTVTYFNIANLALCGMPFLAGFYSKDLILEVVLLSNVNYLIFFFFFFSTGLTVSYSFRLMYYLMIMNFNSFSFMFLNDEGWIMLKSMMILVILSICMGSILSWLIFYFPSMICLSFYLKMLVLLICFSGGILGYVISSYNSLFIYSKMMNNLMVVKFLGNMWFMPLLSTFGSVKIFLIYGGSYYKNIDQGWSELFGGQSLYFYLKVNSMKYQIFQNNNLKLYLLSFFFWLLVIFGFMLII